MLLLSSMSSRAWWSGDDLSPRYFSLQDFSLSDFLQDQSIQLSAATDPRTVRRQEAIWELFTSECVYFLDQLMVLKEVIVTRKPHNANIHPAHKQKGWPCIEGVTGHHHNRSSFPPFSPCFFSDFLPPGLLPSQVFSATLSNLQVMNCLADVDSWRLFANLNELCLVRPHANTTASFTCTMQRVPPACHIATAVFASFWNAAISSFGELNYIRLYIYCYVILLIYMCVCVCCYQLHDRKICNLIVYLWNESVL